MTLPSFQGRGRGCRGSCSGKGLQQVAVGVLSVTSSMLRTTSSRTSKFKEGHKKVSRMSS